MQNPFKSYMAEFLGTFYLCFAGIAAIQCASNAIGGGGGLVAIALAHGLALSIAVHIFGGISGAHVNPAVTLGMVSTGCIAVPHAVGYIVAQLLGATTAALICNYVFPLDVLEATKLGIPLPPVIAERPDWPGIPRILIVEFVLTFLLVTSVFGTAVDERGKAVKIGGFGIGLTVTFDILAGGPVTGALMNPARSFGPALVGWGTGIYDWNLHWCYWAAPIAGSVCAALFYHHVLLKEDRNG